MHARRLPHGLRLVVLLALLAALVTAGCGSSTGGSTAASDAGPDPATVAPADAALYGQATVRPSGGMKAGVLAAARKVLRVPDPAAQLRRLLDSDHSGGTLFSRDVEPWLGQRIGGFLLAPARGAGDPNWAIALAIAHHDAFDAALARMRASGEERAAGTYRGVDYDRASDDGTYSATLGDFYVGGSLAGLRAAIDAQKGPSLADRSRFTDATAGVPADALAFLYADPKALLAAVRGSGPVPPAAQRELARLGSSDPVVASLTATAGEIALEATGDEQLTGDLTGGSNAQVTVGQLPGDAWLALATPPLGPLVRRALDTAGVHDRAAAQVRAETGFDLDHDLLGPLGGLALFARGTSPLDVGGGALLQMTDTASAAALVTRLQAIVTAGAHLPSRPVQLAGSRGFELQVPRLPQPIVVLQRGSRVAAGYAASSAQDLLAPQQRFDESSAGRTAIATLGDGYAPSFVLLVPQLTDLLRSLDELQVADLSHVLPYLDAYRSIAVGTKHDGDRTTVRAVAALR